MAPLTVFLLHSSKVWEFLAVNKRDHSPNTKRGLVVFLVFLSFYFPCSYVYHSEKRRHSGPTGDTPGKPDEKTSKSRSTSGSSQKSLFNFAPPVSFNIYKKCTHWNLCTGSLEVRRGGVYWLTLRIFYFFFRNLPKKSWLVKRRADCSDSVCSSLQWGQQAANTTRILGDLCYCNCREHWKPIRSGEYWIWFV